MCDSVNAGELGCSCGPECACGGGSGCSCESGCGSGCSCESGCQCGSRDVDFAGIDGVAALAKVLGDPVRLRIYTYIAAGEGPSVCVCNLTGLFGVSQPTLSHHLKKLVDAGLIEKRMRGRSAEFSVRPEGLNALRDFVGDVSA